MSLTLIACSIGRAQQISGRLTGTWVKERTQREGGNYPGDTAWALEVTFRKDGRFIWHSTRTDGQGGQQSSLDDSVGGRYSVEGVTITYNFDPVSPEASKRLPELFAYWPRQRKGQQTIRFREKDLVLVHDGGKLWIYLKRKEKSEQALSHGRRDRRR